MTGGMFKMRFKAQREPNSDYKRLLSVLDSLRTFHYEGHDGPFTFCQVQPCAGARLEAPAAYDVVGR